MVETEKGAKKTTNPELCLTWTIETTLPLYKNNTILLSVVIWKTVLNYSSVELYFTEFTIIWFQIVTF